NWTEYAPEGWSYRSVPYPYGGEDLVRKVRLKAAGPSGASQAHFRAFGYGWAPTPHPVSVSQYFNQDPSVIVRLVGSNGLCLASEFPASSAQKNNGDEFKASAR